MSRVTMTHPGVEGQIEVDEVSVPHYQASGWQISDAPQEQQTTPPTAKARRRTRRDED